MAHPAVKVQNACTSYGNTKILDNFQMTVTQGTIYGLLGASGCGKTTILSCLVGLKKLDSGDIFVYGHRPGSKESGIPGDTIGYMPQDMALYEKFTIKEILNYFGKIYGMSSFEISSQSQFLIDILGLPQCTELIQDLSGGQRRRSSLAVAMIHKPKLLILDEPTVGLCPLIRETTWKYLGNLVSNRQTTIILTTHYIEEARQSDTVGLMRNGRLLTEKAPSVLLQEHNANLLEDIVLKLCLRDNANINLNNNEHVFYRKEPQTFPASVCVDKNVQGLAYKARSPDYNTLCYSKSIYRPSRRQSMTRSVHGSLQRKFYNILALIHRNFLMFYRQREIMFFLLMIPAMQIVLYNLIMGKDPTNIPLGIVNQEFHHNGNLEMCNKHKLLDDCFPDHLSCNFLNTFPSSEVTWSVFPNETAALKSAKEGKIYGWISIPENFTQSLKFRALEGNYASNETLDGIEVPVRIDRTNYIKSGYIIKAAYEHYFEFLSSVAVGCGVNPKTLELPLKFNAVYGSVNSGLKEFLQPPLLLLILFALPMTVSVTYLADKQSGTLDRSMAAGVTYFQVVLSHIISEGLMIIAEVAFAFGVFVLVSGLTIKGSIYLALLLFFLTGLCGMSVGFLIGTLCDSQLNCLFCIIATVCPTISTSSILWPIQGTPIWAQNIIKCLPLPNAVYSMRSIFSKDWGITHPLIWPGFASLVAWTLFCCFASGTVYRLRK